MARSESFQCDVCGSQKNHNDLWWLAWTDCFEGISPGDDQPLIKLTRWQQRQAHEEGVKHLCGARCAGTLIDRWMTAQHEDPSAHCESI